MLPPPAVVLMDAAGAPGQGPIPDRLVWLVTVEADTVRHRH